MSMSDRTWPEPLEVPDHVVQRLRAAAEDDLERACDTGGEWNEEIRARVLDAARVVEVFDIGALAPAQLAALAHRAVQLLFADRLAAPRNLEDIGMFVELFGVSRELLVFRDAAAERAERLAGRDDQ